MHRLAITLPLILLCSCSYSGYVTRSAGDYNETVEDATNNMLAVNILRARDEAPLSFSDLSQIRGSISSSVAGQATWPFGPFDHDTMRTNSIQAGPISLAINPTFDIAPLNTKQFSEGILQSVSPNVVYYYFQRNTCPSVYFSLLIGSVKEVDNNSRNEDVDPKVTMPNTAPTEEQLRSWSGFDGCQNDMPMSRTSPKLHFDRSEINVGPELPETILRQRSIIADIEQANSAKLKFKVFGGHIQLYSEKINPVLCVPVNSGMQIEPMVFDTASVISSPSIPHMPKPNICSNDGLDVVKSRVLVASLRSPQAVFYFLGDILRANDDASKGKKLTPFLRNALAVNDLLGFHLRRFSTGDTRFSVSYRGESYYVSEASGRGDDTVTIFSILNDLLNLHRDASEIPTTTAVQSVP